MMAAIIHGNTQNPHFLPEIIDLVINNVHIVPGFLECVNSIWNMAAVKKLYRGSLNDMQFCTPDIGSLNCLFVASQSFVKHSVLQRHSQLMELHARVLSLYALRSVV